MQHLSSKETSPSPVVGLWRIVDCLTPEQTRRFAREIKLLASATFPEQSSVQPSTRAAEGIRVRHSQWCPGRRDAACGCSPRWEAWVYSRKDRGKVRKTFAEHWEAKAWRHRQLELASVGRLHAPSHHTLGETASLWVKMAQEGQIRNRSGRRYKPSSLRTIEGDLRLYLVPNLGGKLLVGVARGDLQRLVSGWLAEGMSPSKIRSIVNAARVLWRDLDLITGHDDQLLIDPTSGLRLPASTGRRERIATPDEARRLIAALQPQDRAVCATASYVRYRSAISTSSGAGSMCSEAGTSTRAKLTRRAKGHPSNHHHEAPTEPPCQTHPRHRTRGRRPRLRRHPNPAVPKRPCLQTRP
jgi:hypothetical protein